MTLINSTDEFGHPRGQIVRYAFGRGCAPLRSAVAVAESFRSATLSALFAITGSKESFLLSGHNADGTPDNEHRHAYYLPQVNEHDMLNGLLVVSPCSRFSDTDLEALSTVRVVQWNGPSTKLTLELIDIDNSDARIVASNWVTITPYVPIRRFWGTSGKHHLTPEKQLASEIHACNSAEVIDDVELSPWGQIRVRIARNGKRVSPTPVTRRQGFAVEIKFKVPLCGPIALGHSCHYGLG
jgi:CRISPR-associated protein Csb2